MKRKTYLSILILCLIGLTPFFDAFAQIPNPPGSGPNGGNVDDTASIMGLLWVLAAAGAVYGIKKKK